MNFIKAQQNLLKVWQDNREIWAFGEYDLDHWAFTIDGYSAVIIPKKLFSLDISKCAKNVESTFFRGWAKEAGTCINNVFTVTEKAQVSGKLVIREFVDANDYVKLVNEKLLKQFNERGHKVTYFGMHEQDKALFVNSDDYGVVGVVVPVHPTRTVITKNLLK